MTHLTGVLGAEPLGEGVRGWFDRLTNFFHYSRSVETVARGILPPSYENFVYFPLAFGNSDVLLYPPTGARGEEPH